VAVTEAAVASPEVEEVAVVVAADFPAKVLHQAAAFLPARVPDPAQ
jgi:hypothetical protein